MIRTSRAAALLAAALVLAACGEQPAEPMTADAVLTRSRNAATIRVTTNADAGPGSFRAAVTVAEASPAIKSIAFAEGIGSIALQSPVTYRGVQRLSIDGAYAVLEASAAGGPAFLATGGRASRSRVSRYRVRPSRGSIFRFPAPRPVRCSWNWTAWWCATIVATACC